MEVHAAERVTRWPKWQRRRVALDRRYAKDEFRIYYTVQGQDALPENRRGDANGNGVPDKIENTALQLIAARRIYVDAMGLRHPLEGPRYKGKAEFFDVHVWDSPSNGMAGDAVVNYHRASDPPEGVAVLTIDLQRELSDRDLSPAHELFHEFINGYTLFKNSWLQEGLCRWSEYALRRGAGKPGKLPATVQARDQLWELSYSACGFWYALARQTDRSGRLPVPADLLELQYVGMQSRVVEDNVLYGAAFVKELLAELDREDDVASRELGLDPTDWKEKQQHSPANSPYIWAAVMRVCKRHADTSSMLQLMVKSLGDEE